MRILQKFANLINTPKFDVSILKISSVGKHDQRTVFNSCELLFT